MNAPTGAAKWLGAQHDAALALHLLSINGLSKDRQLAWMTSFAVAARKSTGVEDLTEKELRSWTDSFRSNYYGSWKKWLGLGPDPDCTMPSGYHFIVDSMPIRSHAVEGGTPWSAQLFLLFERRTETLFHLLVDDTYADLRHDAILFSIARSRNFLSPTSVSEETRTRLTLTSRLLEAIEVSSHRHLFGALIESTQGSPSRSNNRKIRWRISCIETLDPSQFRTDDYCGSIRIDAIEVDGIQRDQFRLHLLSSARRVTAYHKKASNPQSGVPASWVSLTGPEG